MQGWVPLPAPATTVHLRQAVGPFDVAAILRVALDKHGSGDGAPRVVGAAAASGSDSNGSWELL